MLTMYDGYPLYTYSISPASSIHILDGVKKIPVKFTDVNDMVLDDFWGDALPIEKTMQHKAAVTQALRYALDDAKPPKFAHLIYKNRVGELALFSVIVASKELDFEVINYVKEESKLLKPKDTK